MTAARQTGKPRRPWAALAGLALIAASGAISGALQAAEPRIVVNPTTGLALSGVDPVGYFTERRPVFGRPDLELSKFGTVWRFRNEGNRAAFAEHPEVYMPRFGGYDPVAITRDRAVAGNPMIWSVTGERLYLFYDDDDRAAFVADSQRLIALADSKWPELLRTFGR